MTKTIRELRPQGKRKLEGLGGEIDTEAQLSALETAVEQLADCSSLLADASQAGGGLARSGGLKHNAHAVHELLHAASVLSLMYAEIDGERDNAESEAQS